MEKCEHEWREERRKLLAQETMQQYKEWYAEYNKEGTHPCPHPVELLEIQNIVIYKNKIKIHAKCELCTAGMVFTIHEPKITHAEEITNE